MQDYQALTDRHSEEIAQFLEEFGDSQLDTSLQLLAFKNEQRKVDEGNRAATIILPDSDSG